MGNFNRGSKRPAGGGFNRGSGGGSSFGDRKRFGGRDDRFGGRDERFGGRDDDRKSMHKATCSECNASCELPFKPTGERPVFCSDCFGKQRGEDSRPQKFNSDRRDGQRSDFFVKKESGPRDSGEVVQQLKTLNTKIDALIKIMTPNALPVKSEKPEIKEKVLVKEVVKEKQEKPKKKNVSKKT